MSHRSKTTNREPIRLDVGPRARAVAARLQDLCTLRPTLAVVLGSGFQAVVDTMRVVVQIPYNKLPGFPTPGVAGHPGKVVLGHLGNTPVLILNGRAHYYEGHAPHVITFPVRVLAGFGIRSLLLTNAAGGINRRFRPGDFMLIRDHINFMAANPLRTETSGNLSRFVDLSCVYDPGLNQMLESAGKQIGLSLHSGVYLAVSGPSYETPAEIRAFARLGADAIGMSTVPEAIVGRQCGLAVAGISCITNLAAGRSAGPITHKEVLAVGKTVTGKASELLAAFADLYGRPPGKLPRARKEVL